MPDTTDPIAATAAALAAIDTTPFDARLAELANEELRLENAIADAKAQIANLSEEIGQRRASGPDGQAAARALLAGEDPHSAAPTADVLEAKRETLTSALAELNRQVKELPARRDDVRKGVRKLVAAALEPILAAINAELSDALTRVTEAYASHSAIDGALDRFGGRTDDIAKVLSLAASRNLIRTAGIPVPHDTITALRAGTAAIACARGGATRVRTEVLFPTGR